MDRALRLLMRGSIPNGIARYGKKLGSCREGVFRQVCSRRMSTATRTPGSSSRSVQSNVDTRLLIGGGVSLVGAAFAAYQLGVFSIYHKGSTVAVETEEKSIVDNSTTEAVHQSSDVASSEQDVDQDLDKEVAQLPSSLPKHVPYVLIGGGTASFTAMKTIQEHDPNAKILIICEEDFVPYMRPPLSKELWFSDDLTIAADSLNFKQWDGQQRSVFYKDPNSYLQPIDLDESSGVAIATGRKVVAVDADSQRLSLDHGDTLGYDKLLIATGGTPRNLPVFQDSSDDIKNGVTLFRDISDFQKLVKVTQTANSLLVVGGGFLGSELACALGKQATTKGQTITQVFKEDGNMAKVLPKYLSNWTTDRVREEGVHVLPNTVISSVSSRDGQVVLLTKDGKELVADHVIVAVGIDANTDLAESAGLEVDPELGGYRVNAELGAASNIWVAGDASCFYDIKLGRRRVEHHDHAVVSGRLAGENMTGATNKYRHQSMFWSDLGPKVGYEAIGLVDSSLPTVGVWTSATLKDTPVGATEESGSNIRSESEEGEATSAEIESPVVSSEPAVPSSTLEDKSSIITADSPDSDASFMPPQEEMPEIPSNFSKGVVFYMQKNRVVGVVLWNVFNRMPIARRIIDDGKVYDGATEINELAKAFQLYSESE